VKIPAETIAAFEMIAGIVILFCMFLAFFLLIAGHDEWIFFIASAGVGIFLYSTYILLL